MQLEGHWLKLIFWLGVFLVVGVELVRRRRATHRQNLPQPEPKRGPPARTEVAPRSPVGWGPKCGWLAARTTDPERVIAALSLENVEPIDWARGVAAGYATRLFVSPPVEGWVLVMSSSVLMGLVDSEEAKEGTDLVSRLSASLDCEVQYFGTHRVIEAHTWMRADHGTIVRAYSYIGERGETQLDIGPQSAEEVALGFAFFDDRCPEAESDRYWERDDLTLPTEAEVLALAAEWSLDPGELDQWEDGSVPHGWVADFPAAYG
jgi:hypothetical protein